MQFHYKKLDILISTLGVTRSSKMYVINIYVIMNLFFPI